MTTNALGTESTATREGDVQGCTEAGAEVMRGNLSGGGDITVAKQTTLGWAIRSNGETDPRG